MPLRRPVKSAASAAIPPHWHRDRVNDDIGSVADMAAEHDAPRFKLPWPFL
jgi:hypothetical protein